ncbi:CocE/NonD family hydrolase [Kitasatospora indigofera]|uniref:CocE/NonD family hydrolase n=1 Tax=Kitasatospora indigofera TaxID=67307 RepID=UPI0033B21D9F
MTERMEVDFDVPLAMRDGVLLYADVYRPGGPGPWPALVARTPYEKSLPMIAAGLDPVAAVKRGYLVIVQNTRGRGSSQGRWRPLTYEADDGYDTVEWAAGLPRSTGDVGMIGASYLGNAQWMAALAMPPGLKVLTPTFTWSDPHDGLWTRGGAIELGLGGYLSLVLGIDYLTRTGPADPARRRAAIVALIADLDHLVDRTYWELPAGRFPAFARHSIPEVGFERALDDPTAEDNTRVAGRHSRITLPTFHAGGWYDVFAQGVLDNYTAMAATGCPAQLVMGPWDHVGGGLSRVGQVDYGTAAGAASLDLTSSLTARRLDWLDRWLKPATAPSPEPGTAPVKIFVMGPNRWRDEDTWPPARATQTPYYLHDQGQLSQQPPHCDEHPDSYCYDPTDPVATCGGNLLMASAFPPGPQDQHSVEQRPDVLVYTSEPLSQELEVTGRLTVVLHAASDAPSTDWVARLCDVDQDGRSLNIADGIRRIRCRPGEPDEHRIDLWSTSQVFPAGHRLRVQITSSSFPRWDRNPNTGAPPGEATSLRTARQTVFHEPARPSRILLPVLRRSAGYGPAGAGVRIRS